MVRTEDSCGCSQQYSARSSAEMPEIATQTNYWEDVEKPEKMRSDDCDNLDFIVVKMTNGLVDDLVQLLRQFCEKHGVLPWFY